MSNILDVLFGPEYAETIAPKKKKSEKQDKTEAAEKAKIEPAPTPELLNKEIIGHIVCRACGTDIGTGEELGEHLKCKNCDAPIYNPYSEEPRKLEYPVNESTEKYVLALKYGSNVLGYYIADDEPLTDYINKAYVYTSATAAKADAKINNEQWDLERGQKFVVVPFNIETAVK